MTLLAVSPPARLPVDMVDRMMRGVKYVGKDNVSGDDDDDEEEEEEEEEDSDEE